jgi:hypothetical protein
MITFILIAGAGIFAMALIFITFGLGKRRRSGQSGAGHDPATDSPKEGRATGID